MSDTASSAASACPACGAALSQGAVLCTNCGLDLRTGQRAATAPSSGAADRRGGGASPSRAAKKSLGWTLLKLAGLLVVLAVLFYVVRKADRAWKASLGPRHGQWRGMSAPFQDVEAHMREFREYGRILRRRPVANDLREATAPAVRQGPFLCVAAPKAAVDSLTRSIQASESWPVLTSAFGQLSQDGQTEAVVQIIATIDKQPSPLGATYHEDGVLK